MPAFPVPSRLAALALSRPVWVIVLLVAAQHAALIGARDLWWSDEVRHGGVLLDLWTDGKAWALHLNGQPYLDKPPLYFWFVALMQAVFGAGPVPVFLALAVTVLAYALACWHLALRLLADRALALGAVGVLLSGSYVLGASHYARMDFLFAAIIMLAWGSFYVATRGGEVARAPMLAGFALATLATLVKGPVGLLLPLLALGAQLGLQRRLRVLASAPVLAGLGLMLAGVAIWAAGLIYFGGSGQLGRLLGNQIVGRALDTRGGGWWGYLRYLATFPAVLLPFSLLLVRRWPVPASQANRYLLVCVATGLLGLSLIGEKHEYYLIPLLGPAAILIVQAIAVLPVRVSGYTLAAWLALQSALILIAPAVIGWLGLPSAHIAPALQAAQVGALAGLVLAIALAGLVRGRLAWGLRSWGQVLAAFVVAQTLFGTLLLTRVLPALDPVLSPATLTAAMRPAIDQGYAPAVAHGIPGVFAYNLGQHYAALSSPQSVTDWLAATPRAVIALTDAEWRTLAPQHPKAQLLACVPFLGLQFVVLAIPATSAAALPDCPAP